MQAIRLLCAVGHLCDGQWRFFNMFDMSIVDQINSTENKIKMLYEELEKKYSIQFDSTLQHSPDFIVILQNQTIVFVNSVGLSNLNCVHSDVIGKDFYEFIHPDDGTSVKEQLHFDCSNDLPMARILKMHTAHGLAFEMDTRFIPLLDESEPTVLMIGRALTWEYKQQKTRHAIRRGLDHVDRAVMVCEDLKRCFLDLNEVSIDAAVDMERAKTTEKLREKELYYREILRNTHEMIYFLEVNEASVFRFVEVNNRFVKEIGLPQAFCVGKTIEEVFGEEVAASIVPKYRQCIQSGSITKGSMQLNMPYGRRTIHSTLIPIRDANGVVHRLMGLVRDLSEMMDTRREIQISREVLNHTELAASVGFMYVGLAEQKTYCSKGIFNMLELPFSGTMVESLDLLSYIHPEDVQHIKRKLRISFERRARFDEVHRVLDKKGILRVVHTTIDFGQNPVDDGLFLGNMQDVSILSNFENQMLIGDRKLEALFEHSPIGFFLSHGSSTRYVNPTLLELFGVTSLKEFIEISFFELIHPDDRKAAMILFKNLFEYQNVDSSSFQLTLRCKNLYDVSMVLDLRVCTSWLQGHIHVQVMVLDITDEIQRDLDMKQITLDSLYINHKTMILDSVKEDLNRILQNKDYKKADFHDMLLLLESYSKIKYDWSMFDKYFENLHPEFINRMKVLAPCLTINDLKHCACIRLNLDTKEIARFFCVSPATIQKSRVRLKKKLNLPANVDLRLFIETL